MATVVLDLFAGRVMAPAPFLLVERVKYLSVRASRQEPIDDRRWPVGSGRASVASI